MKKDLGIAGILIAIAALALGAIGMAPFLQKEQEALKAIKPQSEPVVTGAAVEAREEPIEPIKPAPAKKAEPQAQKKESTPPEIAKVEPIKKAESKVEPKVEPKAEGPRRPVAKVIPVGDDLIKLNDPDGEYTVKGLHGGNEVKLIGTIKTLKIAGLSERSTLDATALVADAIVFEGGINSGSRVLLGKAHTLRIREVNDKSLLDASALDATAIALTGAVNSGSTVKLHASAGTVEFVGEVNDHARIEIVAPNSKVTFKSRGEAIINSDARLAVRARDVELNGTVNGSQTQINIVLSKDGSLKFRRLNGSVHLHWSKANPADPEPRIEAGEIGARADFRMLPGSRD